MDSPLGRFPEINFEMVHGGTAFVDETIRLMDRHPNLYVTLETTFSYILTKQSHFDRALGKIIGALGSERLLFASGNNLSHPAPLIAAFRDYQFDEQNMERFGIAPLCQQDRDNILGLNALRLHGIDPEELKAAISQDAFSNARSAGIPDPWSVIREP